MLTCLVLLIQHFRRIPACKVAPPILIPLRPPSRYHLIVAVRRGVSSWRGGIAKEQRLDAAGRRTRRRRWAGVVVRVTAGEEERHYRAELGRGGE